MNKNRFPTLAVVALLSTSCSQTDAERFEQAAETLRETSGKLKQAATEATERMDADRKALIDGFHEVQEFLGIDETLPVVEYKDLKRVLPNDVPDYTTGEATGERLVTMGLMSSKAEVNFTAVKGDGSLTLVITDTGSMRGLASLAGKAITASGYEHETDTGYERAFTFRDYEGFERFDTSTRTGSKSILVGHSFHIQVSGKSVPEEDLTLILDAIDYEALIKLKTDLLIEASHEDASPDTT